ncbi:MAG: DUF4347 domain-containing protein, partial [bacterium]|nr:DUF4347 domain-containing protein [bacterium]
MSKLFKNKGLEEHNQDLERFLTPSFSYRELEARIAFDAAIVATVAETFADDATSDAEPAQTDQSQSDPSTTTAPVVEALSSITQDIGATNEIAFIDSSVEDLDVLLASIDAGTEIILLDANRDGVEQIAEILSSRTNVDAIHILSHGDQAELHLGTAILDLASMNGEYTDELAIVNQALADEADILIYGCNFGEGEPGQQAAASLSLITGADIAASDDVTGHASLGGDWDLEVTQGTIEADIAVNIQGQQNWEHTLDAPTDIIFTASGQVTINQSAGTVTATDPDTGDTITYSLVDDAGGMFSID